MKVLVEKVINYFNLSLSLTDLTRLFKKSPKVSKINNFVPNFIYILGGNLILKPSKLELLLPQAQQLRLTWTINLKGS